MILLFMRLHIKDEANEIYPKGVRDPNYIKDISVAYKASKTSFKKIVRKCICDKYKFFTSSISNIRWEISGFLILSFCQNERI